MSKSADAQDRPAGNHLNAYAAAIHRTRDQFTDRTQLYRNLVIAVSLTGVGATGAALVLRSPAPLTMLLFIPPMCGAFFLADRRSLNRWRAPILADWGAGTLELRALTDALRANPAWPHETLQGMLASLPGGGRPADERTIVDEKRLAIAESFAAADAEAAAALASTTAAAVMGALSCAAAAIMHSKLALLGLLAACALPALCHIARRRLTPHADRPRQPASACPRPRP